MFKVGLHSKERCFSTNKQFVRTTDEFWKNVIWSNNLPRFWAFAILIKSVNQSRFAQSWFVQIISIHI